MIAGDDRGEVLSAKVFGEVSLLLSALLDKFSA